MLKDITLGQYYPGNSVIHKLDPRIKIIWTTLYIILLFAVTNFWEYALMAVFTFCVVALSRVPLRFVLRGLKSIFIFMIFTALINLFMTTGQVIFKFWFLTITKEGIIIAVQMVIRLFLLVVGTSMLTLTTSPITLTDGLEKLLSPFSKIGLPSHEIAMMMTIAIRFIPTLLEETDKIIKAQMARGANFDQGKLTERAKALIPLLVPLFVSAFRRADELALAMECRCYNGGENRTRMKQLRMKTRDYASMFVAAVLICAIILI